MYQCRFTAGFDPDADGTDTDLSKLPWNLTAPFVDCEKLQYCSRVDTDYIQIDWSNPQSIHNLLEQLSMFCSPNWLIGLIGAAFLAGIVIGCMTLTRLGDVVGRKPIFMLGVVMHIFFTIGLLLSYNQIADYCLIFIFGMSLTARYYVGYAYNLEM